MSCATPGNCAFGGSGTDASWHVQAFVADLSATPAAPVQTPTATDLALSAATVTFGQEQAGQISVTVTAPADGTPGGKVTITADKTAVCVITLHSGTGSCTLTAKKLRPGSYALTASYHGGRGYAKSASAPATLTVKR